MTHRQSLLLRNVESFTNDRRMYTFRDEAIGLLEKFADKEHDRGGAVADLVVLSDSGTSDHSSSRVLDLHLGEENLAVLGHFDLPRTVHEHFESSTRT